ncbi:uncharacterized protein rubcnl [Festucalex cinctus]
MSCGPRRCKHVCWCVDLPLSTTAGSVCVAPGRVCTDHVSISQMFTSAKPRRQKSKCCTGPSQVQVHASAPQPCGAAPDDEYFQQQSTDQTGLCRSSPVISGCRGRVSWGDADAPSKDSHVLVVGTPSIPLAGTLRLAEKKDRGRGMGHYSAQWELEKENAHLLMVDLVLEMLEILQWTLSQTETTSSGPGRPSGKREQRRCEIEDDRKTCTQSYTQVTLLKGGVGETGSSWFSPLWKAECLGRQLLLDFERRCFASQ